LEVTVDQIGQSIRCPACQAVLQVRTPGDADATALVTCPGCAGKLAIPDSIDAASYRCPKCGMHLATRQPQPPTPVDVWTTPAPSSVFDTGPEPPGLGLSGGPGHSGGPAVEKPIVSSSTQWKSNTAYSSNVGSVVPGVLLLIHATVTLLINVVQFFYAMGFSDELKADQEVQVLRTTMIASSVLGSLYVSVIAAGSVQMIFRQRLWLGRLACILAVVPLTAVVCGPQWVCVTSLWYGLALVGGIWGLVVLFGRHARR
jgi:hypothetical protein